MECQANSCPCSLFSIVVSVAEIAYVGEVVGKTICIHFLMISIYVWYYIAMCCFMRYSFSSFFVLSQRMFCYKCEEWHWSTINKKQYWWRPLTINAIWVVMVLGCVCFLSVKHFGFIRNRTIMMWIYTISKW